MQLYGNVIYIKEIVLKGTIEKLQKLFCTYIQLLVIVYSN